MVEGLNSLQPTVQLFKSWENTIKNRNSFSNLLQISKFNGTLVEIVNQSLIILKGNPEQKDNAIEIINNAVIDLIKIVPLTAITPTSIQLLLDYEKEISNRISQHEEKFNNLILKIESQNELLNTQFLETTERFERIVSVALKNAETDSKNINNDYEKKANEAVETLDEIVEKGKTYGHFLSGRALSGFFSDRATEEKKSAENWTKATWGFAVAALVVLFIIFILQILNVIQDQGINYSFLATKALFVATLGFIAKWTSKRANRHIAEECKYHRLAVNLHTIDDYISKLKPDSQDEILKAVALKTFTETNENGIVADFETANLLDIGKNLLTKSDK